ncbi:hypothetical protein BH23BAC2_BH23BAC2_05640 [soil metagenome]
MQRLKITIGFIVIILLAGCSQLNKATDLLSNPTSKERYKRDFKISDGLFQIWEDQLAVALRDSIQIQTPFLQAGYFKPRSFPIYSYNIDLNVGEKLDISVETDSISHLVFIELYQLQNDSLGTYKSIAAADYNRKSLGFEVDQGGTYKVIIQPEISASTPFQVKMKTFPVYLFPVAGAKNTNIQSFWGATRDAGRRSHEGIDIFAARGTPVIAVTDGYITSSGERGLGGKQVWLRDQKRGQSLYYAHLDSIAPLGKTRVKTGDTIGFVGNTGNARTTPPHLHFGIYKGYRGAIDPLHFVYQLDQPNFDSQGTVPEVGNLVTKSTANIRNQPGQTRKSQVIGNLPARDTVNLLGKSNEWYHIRTSTRQAAFIHESLVSPI